MTSTDVEIGMAGRNRPSSRVLKPPGGGHSNIFAEPESSVNAPRPKYNQQNSSNLNACIGSTDPNLIVEKLREEITQQPSSEPKGVAAAGERVTPKEVISENGNNGGSALARGRIPPGGYSSGGFW